MRITSSGSLFRVDLLFSLRRRHVWHHHQPTFHSGKVRLVCQPFADLGAFFFPISHFHLRSHSHLFARSLRNTTLDFDKDESGKRTHRMGCVEHTGLFRSETSPKKDYISLKALDNLSSPEEQHVSDLDRHDTVTNREEQLTNFNPGLMDWTKPIPSFLLEVDKEKLNRLLGKEFDSFVSESAIEHTIETEGVYETVTFTFNDLPPKERMFVTLKMGDITEEKTDILVNPTISSMRITKEGVNNAVHTKAGPGLSDFVELIDGKIVETIHRCGTARPKFTPSFRLSDNICFICHTSVPEASDKTVDIPVLTSVYQHIFEYVSLHFLGVTKSLSIPALGCGYAGFNKRDAARVALGVVAITATKLNAQNTRMYPRDIRFVFSDKVCYREWLKECNRRNLQPVHKDELQKTLVAAYGKKHSSQIAWYDE